MAYNPIGMCHSVTDRAGFIVLFRFGMGSLQVHSRFTLGSLPAKCKIRLIQKGYPDTQMGRANASELRSPVSVFRFQVSNLRSPISGLRSPVSDLRFPVSNLRFQVSGLRFQVSGLQSPVSGFRFQNSGFQSPVSCLRSQDSENPPARTSQWHTIQSECAILSLIGQALLSYSGSGWVRSRFTLGSLSVHSRFAPRLM